jgi:hypothetical protein
MKKIKQFQNKKFDNLLKKQVTKDIFKFFDETWVENLTDVTLPVEMKLLLSFGPKFSINSGRMTEKDGFKIICDIEYILQNIRNVSERQRVRNNLVGFIQNKLLENRKNLSQATKYLNQILIKTTSFIQEHNSNNPEREIMITVADKGAKSVVLYKHQYHENMLAMLSDNTTYKPLHKDPTGKHERKNNLIVKSLLDLKMIDTKTRTSLAIYKSVTPKIYLLPKIHKTDFDQNGNRILKFRPIVSAINCPSYRLGKFIGQIINQSIDHSLYNIRNSYQFHEFIKKQIIPPGYKIVSFDVVSLFTSIPRFLVYQCIIQEWYDISKHTKISLKMFLKCVMFIFRSSYFRYDGKFYDQCEGTGMGLCPSPNFADLVMTCLLNKVSEDLEFKILFIKKYVDDLILAIPEDKISVTLAKFNSFNQFLQFTVESEENRCLPFLDMEIFVREMGNITTKWYKKSISSGRILSFLSSHPRSQLVNTAEGFIQRALSLTSQEHREEMKNVIWMLLKKNNYP